MDMKPIGRDAIPAALAKADRYRLLNEAEGAESICLDVLAVDPDNQQALVALLLSITDQFAEGRTDRVTRARELLPRITGDYERHYYSGIIAERRAKAKLHSGAMGAGEVAAEWLREAMQHYEQAERLRPPDNDACILRWNTCARLLLEHEKDSADAQDYAPALED
jgi:hypothetical protein